MRGDVGPNARLVEGVHGGVGPIKHSVEFEDIAISLGATEFVSSALSPGERIPRVRGECRGQTSKHRTNTFFWRVSLGSGTAMLNDTIFE